MAASTYKEALRLLLAHEGGYANNPSDPGGETNYGITIKTARENGYQGSMRAIPMDVVERIYRGKYWDELACDTLPAGVDYAIFDYGVNSGVSRAKRVLDALQPKYPDPAALVIAICDERLAFLKRLATWKVFGKGWTRRVAEVRLTGSAMAKNAASPPIPPPPDIPVPEPKPQQPASRGFFDVLLSAFLAIFNRKK